MPWTDETVTNLPNQYEWFFDHIADQCPEWLACEGDVFTHHFHTPDGRTWLFDTVIVGVERTEYGGQQVLTPKGGEGSVFRISHGGRVSFGLPFCQENVRVTYNAQDDTLSMMWKGCEFENEHLREAAQKMLKDVLKLREHCCNPKRVDLSPSATMFLKIALDQLRKENQAFSQVTVGDGFAVGPGCAINKAMEVAADTAEAYATWRDDPEAFLLAAAPVEMLERIASEGAGVDGDASLTLVRDCLTVDVTLSQVLMELERRKGLLN